jgi:hypothetical protein
VMPKTSSEDVKRSGKKEPCIGTPKRILRIPRALLAGGDAAVAAAGRVDVARGQSDVLLRGNHHAAGRYLLSLTPKYRAVCPVMSGSNGDVSHAARSPLFSVSAGWGPSPGRRRPLAKRWRGGDRVAETGAFLDRVGIRGTDRGTETVLYNATAPRTPALEPAAA